MSLGVRSWALAAIAVVIGAAGGYAVGHHGRASTHTAVGTAYSSRSEITVKAGTWAYGVPVDAQWTDGSGGIHDGSRPPCIPPTGVIKDVRFEWTAWHYGGNGGRTVVEVNCS